MKLFSFSNILTLALIVLAISGTVVFVLGQNQFDSTEYASHIKYTFTRLSLRYDYSCDQNVYGLFLILKNAGSKNVENLSIAVSDELCVGSIPPIQTELRSNQSVDLYIYSTAPNGTVSVTGNDTNLFIRF